MTSMAMSVAAGAGAMTDAQFERIASIAYQAAGLTIPKAKSAMVQSRLQKRMRKIGLTGLDAYLDLVTTDTSDNELAEMISVLTTNVSSFFREDHHFSTLREEVLPQLLEGCRSGGSLRIWSAGCSSGQEPYSIAMTILDMAPEADRLNVKILATDIDQNILQRAQLARYDQTLAAQIPADLATRFVVRDKNDPSNFEISQSVRGLVTFRKLNLLETWPMKNTFDVIFCRNVLIYFNEETQNMLWPRFQSQLSEKGWMFIGHSERMNHFAGSEMIPCGITTYRRQRR